MGIDNWRNADGRTADPYAGLRAAIDAGPVNGPWSATHNNWECSTVYCANGPLATCTIDSLADEVTQPDYEREKEATAAYIAAANPATIRTLLAERDSLAGEVERLRAALSNSKITGCTQSGASDVRPQQG